jgi:PAS domain S-box-containing protein
MGGLVQAAPGAIVVFDPDRRIVLVNRQAEQLFGYRRGDLLVASVHSLLVGI